MMFKRRYFLLLAALFFCFGALLFFFVHEGRLLLPEEEPAARYNIQVIFKALANRPTSGGWWSRGCSRPPRNTASTAR